MSVFCTAIVLKIKFFPYEKFCTRTCFETELKDNTEMAFSTVHFSGVVSLHLFWNALVFCFYTGGHEASGTFGIFTSRAEKEVAVLKQYQVVLISNSDGWLQHFSGFQDNRKPIVQSLACERLRSVADFIRSQYTTYRSHLACVNEWTVSVISTVASSIRL